MSKMKYKKKQRRLHTLRKLPKTQRLIYFRGVEVEVGYLVQGPNRGFKTNSKLLTINRNPSMHLRSRRVCV